jgi:hypothetical protein
MESFANTKRVRVLTRDVVVVDRRLLIDVTLIGSHDYSIPLHSSYYKPSFLAIFAILLLCFRRMYLKYQAYWGSAFISVFRRKRTSDPII